MAPRLPPSRLSRMWCIFTTSDVNEITAQWRNYLMRPFRLAFVLAVAISIVASIGSTQDAPATGPYQVLKKAKVGGEGGFDYITADVENRRLYIPRNGPMGQLTAFNLDTLEPAGSIAGVKSGGAAVDPKSHHG